MSKFLHIWPGKKIPGIDSLCFSECTSFALRLAKILWNKCYRVMALAAGIFIVWIKMKAKTKIYVSSFTG